MWPFRKREQFREREQAVAAAVETVETVQSAVPVKKVECPPFGAQVAGLIRFGSQWVNLNEISAIDFEPSDGCGAETRFKNSDEVWHWSHEDSLALRTYLESFESIRQQVDQS